jgi:hypothetical protein
VIGIYREQEWSRTLSGNATLGPMPHLLRIRRELVILVKVANFE